MKKEEQIWLKKKKKKQKKKKKEERKNRWEEENDLAKDIFIRVLKFVHSSQSRALSVHKKNGHAAKCKLVSRMDKLTSPIYIYIYTLGVGCEVSLD